jgi:hypothetical protein
VIQTQLPPIVSSFFSKERKLVQIFLMLTQSGKPPSAAIQAGLPVGIVELLAEMCTLKSKKEMHKRKEMLGIGISYLICVPRVESHRVAGSLGLLPCCLATPIGLSLLTFKSGPHSQ